MRRFPRAPHKLRVAYKNFDGRTDYTGNISVAGAFIQTSNPSPRGALLGLFFDVPTIEVPLEVGAEVKWCSWAGRSAGMGVQFIYTSEPHRQLFERELEKLNSTPAP